MEKQMEVKLQHAEMEKSQIKEKEHKKHESVKKALQKIKEQMFI